MGGSKILNFLTAAFSPTLYVVLDARPAMVCPTCNAEYTWSTPCECHARDLTAPAEPERQRDAGSSPKNADAMEPTGIDNPFWH
jgi:hypothetical protein